MKVGVISDSHDNVPAVNAAVDILNRENVDAVIHCGDFVAPFSLLPFRNLECGLFYAVFGNNDGEKTGLMKVASDNGWHFSQGPFEFELGGRKVAVMHEPFHLNDVLTRKPDIALFGHTHRYESRREAGTFLLNPGESGGWLTGRQTCAILDTGLLEARVIEING